MFPLVFLCLAPGLAQFIELWTSGTAAFIFFFFSFSSHHTSKQFGAGTYPFRSTLTCKVHAFSFL